MKHSKSKFLYNESDLNISNTKFSIFSDSLNTGMIILNLTTEDNILYKIIIKAV